MDVITVSSTKGGSGKTTLSIALAATLVDEAKRKVFLLDLDPGQQSALRWFTDTHKLYGSRAVPNQSSLGCDSIPQTGDSDAMIEDMLAILRRIDGAFDTCIIDTQGIQSPLNVAAMTVSDLVLIPFRLTGLEMEPLIATYEMAESAVRNGVPIRAVTMQMPNILPSTQSQALDILRGAKFDVVIGTRQLDGYQQIALAAGTFRMIERQHAKDAEQASALKARRKAEREIEKVQRAAGDARIVCERLGLMKTPAKAKKAATI